MSDQNKAERLAAAVAAARERNQQQEQEQAKPEQMLDGLAIHSTVTVEFQEDGVRIGRPGEGSVMLQPDESAFVSGLVAGFITEMPGLVSLFKAAFKQSVAAREKLEEAGEDKGKDEGKESASE